MTSSLLAPSPGIDIDAEFARIVDELTRRGFLAGGIGAAAALGLAACTSDGAAPSASAATRRIQTAQGVVEVPANPRRVVTLDQWSANLCFDLGVTPVAAPSNIGVLVADKYQRAYAKVPSFGLTYQPDIEKIAAARPELILISSAFLAVADTGFLDPIAKIAPVVVAEYGIPKDRPELAFASNDTVFAQALNRSHRLAGLRASFERAFDTLRSDYGAVAAAHSWAVIAAYDTSSFAIWNANNVGNVILSGLGARWAPSVPSTEAVGAMPPGTNLSLEDIDQLAGADVIVIGAGTDPASLKKLQSSPLWAGLPAVRAGRVFSPSASNPVGFAEADEYLTQLRDILTRLKENR